MPVPAPLRTASEVAARALVVGLAVLLAGALLWKLRLMVLPVFIALLLATVLTPPVVALERRGWPSAVATAGVFLAFLAALAAVLTLVVPPTVDELSSTGSALQDGLDEVRTTFLPLSVMTMCVSDIPPCRPRQLWRWRETPV